MHKIYKRRFHKKDNKTLETIVYTYESYRHMINVLNLPALYDVTWRFFKKYDSLTAEISELIDAIRASEAYSDVHGVFFRARLKMTKYYINRLTEEMLILTYDKWNKTKDGDAMMVMIWLRTLRHVLLNASTKYLYYEDRPEREEIYRDTDSIEQTT